MQTLTNHQDKKTTGLSTNQRFFLHLPVFLFQIFISLIITKTNFAINDVLRSFTGLYKMMKLLSCRIRPFIRDPDIFNCWLHLCLCDMEHKKRLSVSGECLLVNDVLH